MVRGSKFMSKRLRTKCRAVDVQESKAKDLDSPEFGEVVRAPNSNPGAAHHPNSERISVQEQS